MRLVFILIFSFCVNAAFPCTSAIITSRAAKYGSPMLWKHRDTSHKFNYLDSVTSDVNPNFDYIALFNCTDSLKREAWAGANRAGFAIINTVAGNLSQNSPDYCDMEGYIMTRALSSCITVADFMNLLDSLPRPMGIRTNFGVMDISGEGGYIEAYDYGYTFFPISKAENGVLIRSNFSFSSTAKGGYGYERYHHAETAIDHELAHSMLAPEFFTEKLSRQYYNSYTGQNNSTSKCDFKDSNYIPRPSSASSVVIELTPTGPVMWTMLGYPPMADVIPATIDSVPPQLKRNPISGLNDMAAKANDCKNMILKNGMIKQPLTGKLIQIHHKRSIMNYSNFRNR